METNDYLNKAGAPQNFSRRRLPERVGNTLNFLAAAGWAQYRAQCRNYTIFEEGQRT